MRQNSQITLYAFAEGFGLPEISPYCTKAEIHLMIAGLLYRKETAMPDASPKGQLPFIVDDGETIADSTFIRAHIEAKYRFDFDAGLDAGARAQAWAIERLLENHFGFAIGYFRWLDPANFAKGPAHFFDHAPDAIRDTLRRDVQARVADNMKAVGIGRHAPDEIVRLGERSLMALSVLLGDKAYLFGDKPCGTDATAFAMLAAVLTPFFDSPLRRRAESYGNLVGYTDRLMHEYYPAFRWKPSIAA
jgi:glutathione S-transferase